MQHFTWSLFATLSVLLVHVTLTSYADAQEVLLVSDPNLNPVSQEVSGDVFGPESTDRADRGKRKILEPVVQASFGIKSALLNLIFGKVNQLIDYKTRLVDQLDRKNVALNKAYGLGRKPCDTPTGTTASTGFQGYVY